MAKLTEAQNVEALRAAQSRGARVHGLLDPKSQAIVDEERARIADRDAPKGEPMRSAGELAQEEAAATPAQPDHLGTPMAGGGA